MKLSILRWLMPLILYLPVNAQSQENTSKSISQGAKPSPHRFYDLEDQVRSLDEFKGRYILIDIWASWCEPCRRQFPALDSLRNHYVGSNLVVLGINTDHMKFRWTGSIQHHQLPHPQWSMGEENVFNEEFDIEYIPRFILIDPDGKVVNERMPLPSDPAIYRILDQYLQTSHKQIRFNNSQGNQTTRRQYTYAYYATNLV